MENEYRSFTREDYALLPVSKVQSELLIESFDCGHQSLNNDLIDAFRCTQPFEWDSYTFCLVKKDMSGIVGYFTISDRLFFADQSYKSKDVVSLLSESKSPEISKSIRPVQIYYFAVDRHYQRTQMASRSLKGYGRFLMAYAFEEIIKTFEDVGVVFLESTIQAKLFYPAVGFIPLENDTHLFTVPQIMKSYIEAMR
jgi:hypothetical protein